MTNKSEMKFTSSLGSPGFLFDIEADMWFDTDLPRRMVSLTIYGEDGVAGGNIKNPIEIRRLAAWLTEAADFLEGKKD